MQYKKPMIYITENDEPILRSCWKCNSAHDRLKHVDKLHMCFVCGQYWIHGKMFSDFESEEALDDFLKRKLKGVKDEYLV